MTTDPDPLHLLDHLGIDHVIAASRIPGGFGDSAIWRVELDNPEPRIFALRLFAPDDVRGFRRESAAMLAAGRQGVPVPGIVSTGTVDGRPVMLMEWCPGRTLLEELLHHPERVWVVGMQMGTIHGRLHCCKSGPDLSDCGTDWIAWMGPGEPELQERLTLSRDRAALPATVLHLDFHPANVLMRSGRVTGVIDWANAGSGDLRADVARTASILRFAPLPPGLPQAKITHLRRIFRRGWRLGHRRTHGNLPNMELFDAWALAVMVRDLGLKVGRDNAEAMGLSEAYFDGLHRTLAKCKKSLGIG